MFTRLLSIVFLFSLINCATKPLPILPLSYPNEEQKNYEKPEHWDKLGVRIGADNDAYITIFPMVINNPHSAVPPKVCAGNVGDNAGLKVYLFDVNRNIALFDKLLQQNTGACENVATYPGDIIMVSLTPIRPQQIAENTKYNASVVKDKAVRGGKIGLKTAKNFTEGAKKTTEKLVNTGELQFNHDPLLPDTHKYPPTKKFIPLTSSIKYTIQIGADLPLDNPPTETPMINQQLTQKIAGGLKKEEEIEQQLDKEAIKISRIKKKVAMTYFVDGKSIGKLIVKNDNDKSFVFILRVNCQTLVEKEISSGEEKNFSLSINIGGNVAIFTKTGDSEKILDSLTLKSYGTITDNEDNCL